MTFFAKLVRNGSHCVMAILETEEFFGVMAIFEWLARVAKVCALGQARLLTVDTGNLMGRIHQDPWLAYRMLVEMSQRIRDVSSEVASLDQQIAGLAGG